MTGSAEKATEVVAKLKKIGAETPFEMPQLAETTQLLMNYGFTADQAIERMKMLGDISQGNADKMNRIATAYGQMSSAGKVQLEDIKQMIEAGFNPLQEISETTSESMESLYDRISKGTLSVDEITASMVRSTSEGGKYFQSMEKQSQTLQGRLSTLKDVSLSTLGTLFEPLSEGLRDNVIPSITSNFEILQNILETQGTSAFVDKLGGVIQLGLTNLVGFIKEKGTELVSMGASLLGDIATGLISQIPTLIPVAFEIINNLLNGLLENLPMILSYGQSTIQTLLQGIQENSSTIIQGALTIITSLLDFMLENLPMILQVGLQVLIQLVQGISENLPTLIPVVLDTIMLLVTELINQAPLLLDSALQLILSLAQGLINYLPQLINRLPEIIQGIISFLLSEGPKILKTGVKLIIELGKGLIEAIPQLVKKAPEIISGIVNGLKDGFSNIVNVGKDIVRSLWDGIKSMGSWIKDKISGFFGGVGDFVGGLFGGGKSRMAGYSNSYGSSIFDGAMASRSVVSNNYNRSINTTNNNNATYNFYNTQTSPDSIRRSVQRINTYGLAGGAY